MYLWPEKREPESPVSDWIRMAIIFGAVLLIMYLSCGCKPIF